MHEQRPSLVNHDQFLDVEPNKSILASQEVEHPIAKLAEWQRLQLRDEIRRAQVMTQCLAQEILSEIRPGMTEADSRQVAELVFRRYHPKVIQQWHRPLFRHGPNTCLSILATTKVPDHALRPIDMGYMDIGPVFKLNGRLVEGDFGINFSVGAVDTYFEALKNQAVELFHEGTTYMKQYFKSEQIFPSGKALYEYLEQAAKKRGLMFTLNPAGHLIGTFPHQGWKKGLNHYPYPVDPGLWIQEIQVVDPETGYGSFYENLLE